MDALKCGAAFLVMSAIGHGGGSHGCCCGRQSRHAAALSPRAATITAATRASLELTSLSMLDGGLADGDERKVGD